MKMRKYVFTLLCAVGALWLFSSCQKECPKYQSKGVILKVDWRKCSCCGGYFIAIKNDTLRAQSLPAASGITMEDAFPMKVELDWTRLNSDCGGDHLISVERIRKAR